MNQIKIKGNKLMPLLFVGHGSPMNALEQNSFSKTWQVLGNDLPHPRAIVCISAHWETNGSFVTAMKHPKTIYDFYGFPPELYRVKYSAPGNPEFAEELQLQFGNSALQLDYHWGLDHGCWSVLKHLFPKADVPVLQLSLDRTKDWQWHFHTGEMLSSLRSSDVLVIGSGNLVHNLRLIDWNNPDGGYSWAEEARNMFNHAIEKHNISFLTDQQSFNHSADLAVPTPEHFLPLLYILGAMQEQDSISFFNDQVVMGSLSMTSLLIQQ